MTGFTWPHPMDGVFRDLFDDVMLVRSWPGLSLALRLELASLCGMVEGVHRCYAHDSLRWLRGGTYDGLELLLRRRLNLLRSDAADEVISHQCPFAGECKGERCVCWAGVPDE